MGQLPESTFNLILSALIGAISGLITIPINAYILWVLKRDEMQFQQKLNMIAKQRELYLQHRLELERQRAEFEQKKAADLVAKQLQKEMQDANQEIMLEMMRKDENDKKIIDLENSVKKIWERLSNG